MPQNGIESPNITRTQLDVLADIQTVWQHNVFWTYMYMQSSMFNSPNQLVIEEGILSLADAYGRLLGQYYGNGTKMILEKDIEAFFKTYIQYIEKLTQGEQAAQTELHQQWKEIGRKLAQKLSDLNPYWGMPEWNAMILQQIKMLDMEADNCLQGKYNSLESSFELFSRLATDMGNYMASGVIKQFGIS